MGRRSAENIDPTQARTIDAVTGALMVGNTVVVQPAKAPDEPTPAELAQAWQKYSATPEARFNT